MCTLGDDPNLHRAGVTGDGRNWDYVVALRAVLSSGTELVTTPWITGGR